MSKKLQPIGSNPQRLMQLEAEFGAARQKLQDAEKLLAEEQAAVNAFRMHCRLTIGHWVDSLLELRSEKESLLTQKRLFQQELDIEEPVIDPEETQREEMPQDDVDSIASSILEELVDAEAQREAEKSLYRDLARRFHPDLAANNVEKAYRTSIMAAVNAAYQQRDLQTMRDLAGELDPEVVAEIEAIDSSRIKKLRRKIVRCQKIERKVMQQLKALRRENTAKLWRKSKDIEERTSDWWQEIKVSLEEDVKSLEKIVAKLREEVGQLEKLKEKLVDS